MARKKARIDQRLTYDMSFNEMVGAIFMRSQIIEQLMREMIMRYPNYKIPKDFDKQTYGGLLHIFSDLYPDITKPYDDRLPEYSLHWDLLAAKEARDNGAHGHFLIGVFILDLLHDYGKPLDKNRFIMKGLRKDLWVVDEAMAQLMNYCGEHDWRGWGSESKIGDQPS